VELSTHTLVQKLTLCSSLHQVSHTSDHFELCEKYARQIIKDGLAYMDNTDQETMQVSFVTQLL
jgi:glutamyl/glutaminyl-tRNA synthetase